MSKDTQLSIVEKTFVELDEYAKVNTLATITEGKGNFTASLALAQGIEYLQSKLTNEIMSPLMRLQGSPLGFRTDKDKTGGYDIATVRDVMIDATIKGGFLLFGNEVNIIAGRGYITKEGFQGNFKRRAAAGLCTYPEVSIGAPKQVGDGFLLACTAKSVVNGKTISVSADIPVKGQSADQVIGKGTRKILARLYERVTGIAAGEADLSDGAIDVTATTTTGSGSAPSLPTTDGPDAEMLAKLDEFLNGYEASANQFLIENGAISPAQNYRQVSLHWAKRILNPKNNFLSAIGAK